MASKFEFLEIVRVNPKSPGLESVAGSEGAVLGKSQDEAGKWGYAVFIYGLDETWDLQEIDLESMGRMAKHEDFCDGTSIRVAVDPETGEGRIVEQRSSRQES